MAVRRIRTVVYANILSAENTHGKRLNMYCEPNFFDDKKHCKPKPDCKPEYSPLPPFHDKPDMPLPPCGYIFPPVKPYCPGVSPEEQMGILTERVNELIQTINNYSTDVYGAYNAIVNSALCNDAYYNEITTEEGYIAEASAKYKVIHIPFLDRAKEPIYFELGLAYNNTTNANVHEDVFNASQRTIADKLIPAYNSDNTWVGAVVWKGAPIGNIGELPATYTFGVTDNGFFKVYENLTDYTQLKQDCVRNAFEARSILIQGGNLTPDKFEPDEKNQQLGRVGVGMNYDTKERFIVIVQGSNQSGCTTEQLANIFKTYNCNMAVELSNGMMTTALDKGAFMFVPPTADGVSVPTIPEVNAFWYITKRRHYHNEYVRDVANLTQKYGEMLWRTETANISVDNVKAVVAGFQRALETETAERKAADETLQANIYAEAEAREQGDTTLQQNINTLSQHVDEVKQELTQADATLQQNIDNLRTELTAKDIDSVEKTADGNKNIYRLRLNDTTYVDVAIETYDYSLLTQKLDTLSNLEPRLEAEITARQEADQRIEAKADANTADIANLKTDKVNKAGDTMTGDLDMQQHTVTNLKDPVNETDAVTLKYFNDNKQSEGEYLPTAGGTMTGNLDMGNNKVVNLADPTADGDAVNKKYFEAQVPQIIENNLAGDNSPIGEAIDGRLVFHFEQGVTTQKELYDAYVNGAKFIISESDGDSILFALVEFDDLGDGTYQFIYTGIQRGVSPFGSMLLFKGNKTTESAITDITQYRFLTSSTGIDADFNANGVKITNLEAPDADTDAANKAYVDSALHNVPSQALRHLTSAELRALTINEVITDFDKYAGYVVSNDSETIIYRFVSFVEDEFVVDFAVGTMLLTYTGTDLDTTIESATPTMKPLMSSDTAGNYTAGTKKIVSVGTPTEDTDASTKKYVDDTVNELGSQLNGLYLPKAGGVMTGNIDMDGHDIINPERIWVTDIPNSGAKGFFIDTYSSGGVSAPRFVVATGTGSGQWSGESTPIFIGEPTQSQHAATKNYVDEHVSQAGGGDFMSNGSIPMSGNLNMDNHKITALSDPADSTDGANKHYVDSAVTSGIAGAQFLPLAGGTLTGPLTLTAAPSADLQAATKKYVDDATATIATLTSQLATANSEIATLKSQVATLNTFMNKFQPMLNTIYNG